MIRHQQQHSTAQYTHTHTHTYTQAHALHSQRKEVKYESTKKIMSTAQKKKSRQRERKIAAQWQRNDSDHTTNFHVFLCA